MITRIELKQKAKEQIKGNVLILFVISIITSIDTFSGSFNGGNFANNNGFVISLSMIMILRAMGLGLVLFILSLIVMCPLKISQARIYLGVSSEEKPKFSMLAYGFKNCWEQSALLGLLSAVFIFLWSLLLVIPGIVKYYAYRMSDYIMAENPDINALDAIKKSEEMMKGHKLELFILDLSFIWWYLLVGITFGIALVYVMPYVMASRTNFYLKIKEEQAEK